MDCALQITLFLLGAWLLSRSVVKLGGLELRPPFTIFAGLILAIQLPVAIGVSFALGGAEGVKAAREGVEKDVAVSRAKKKYWWVGLAVSGSALLVGGVVIGAGLREPVRMPPPPDDPVGITDFRALRAEKWDTERRSERMRYRGFNKSAQLRPPGSDSRESDIPEIRT